MRVITEEQVRECLTMPRAIELVEQSFRQLADGSAVNHPRRRVILKTGSILHYMAAGNNSYFGTKVYSTNPKTGAHFTFLLYRSADGTPLATLQASHLGQIRTGAASAVATNLLARKDSKVLAVIGSGFQAQTQIAAIAAVRDLAEVRVWSRKPERRAEFARTIAAHLALNVRAPETAREAIEGADIVVTATSSKEPVLESSWVSPGTHINAMGSNWLIKRELPPDLVLEKADIVTVDSVEDAHLESGDLVISGQAFRADEFSDHIAGAKPGRTNPRQITIFKSNGLAIQDVVCAGYVYEKLYS